MPGRAAPVSEGNVVHLVFLNVAVCAVIKSVATAGSCVYFFIFFVWPKTKFAFLF